MSSPTEIETTKDINELADELMSPEGNGRISLDVIHMILTGQEWDGTSSKYFDDIVETFKDYCRIHVEVRPKEGSVVYLGSMDERLY